MSVSKVSGFHIGVFWRRAGAFLLTACLLLTITGARPVHATATLELYGTFNAMGVIVELAARAAMRVGPFARGCIGAFVAPVWYAVAV